MNAIKTEQPVKLIALDLDGTLLTSDKRLSPENEAALRRAAEAGVEIVPATGRFYSAIPDCVRKLPYLRYAITINGAQVWDIRDRRALYAAEIPWPRAVELMEYLDRLPVIYDCYMDNWGWMSQSHQARAADFAPHRHSLEMLQKLRTPVPELKAFLAERRHDVQKVMMFFQDPELRLRSLEDLARRFPDLAVTSSIPRNLELNSRLAQKGLALEALARRLGIPMAETIAFGDDLNDLSMLRAAGLGAAMGNASAEVKAAANYVTAACDENGIALALEALLFSHDPA